MPHDPETGLLIISTHDLTRRSTKSNASTILNGVNFNSRSHKEVDFHARRCVLCRICISTHDLTKRSTHHLSNTDHIDRVSTHDLAKRSTVGTIGRKTAVAFQLTTSRRGRRRSKEHQTRFANVSTHDLTKRSTYARAFFLFSYNKFQLTTSRRGRLISCTSKSVSYGVSTHDLTKRSTVFRMSILQ